MFTGRVHAGRELAVRLEGVVRRPSVIAAIPRGGVPVALPISERLGVPLTVAYARQLTDSSEPEVAFGSLAEDGDLMLDQATISVLGLSPAAVERARLRVAAEIRRRIELYRGPLLGWLVPGRTAIIVDNGLPTGLTMQAAVSDARRHGAHEIVVAVPCASASATRRLRESADRVVALVVDDAFTPVAHYYADFPPVGVHEAGFGRSSP